MRRMIFASFLLVLTGCEEIAYVTVVAPPELVGASVREGGEEVARLTLVTQDGRVRTPEPLVLPPLATEVVILKKGCDPVSIVIDEPIGKSTVSIDPASVRCTGS